MAHHRVGLFLTTNPEIKTIQILFKSVIKSIITSISFRFQRQVGQWATTGVMTWLSEAYIDLLEIKLASISRADRAWSGIK